MRAHVRVGRMTAPGPSSMPAAGEVVFTTTGLSKDYGQVLALDSLDVTVGPGVTGLVGANGAGKSTLIKILLGLLEPTAGTASVLGHDIAVDGAAIRARVGYMPEHECLPPDVSASDFVVHMAQMSGLPHPAARERAADVLRHVGLAEERYRPMGGYSTGMKQRAKLAQALAHDPKVVMLDEPTNGLDPAARDDMLELVRRIGHDFGIAVLVTSHLLGELERVSDHVVVLDGGRLLRSSATSEFLDTTGALLVEVLGGAAERDRLGQALHDSGFAWQPRGTLVRVDPPPESETRDLHDAIRDTAVALGLGLVRIQPDHHRIEDIFREEVAGATQPH